MSEETMNENVNETVENDEVRTYPNLTPYFAAKVANGRFAAEGIEREMQGPQMYNYAKNGLIESNYNTRGPKEKIVMNGQSFKAWLDRYVERTLNGEQAGSADIDKLVELFS
jgi:hypothetical protein